MFLLTIKAWNQSVTPDFQENKDEFCSILLFCCDFSPKWNVEINLDTTTDLEYFVGFASFLPKWRSYSRHNRIEQV